MFARPLFIVGVGRSGTSLLQALLNAHSKVCFLPETHFVRTYLAKGIGLHDCREKILSDPYLLRLDVNLGSILEQSDSCEVFYKNLLSVYLKNNNKVVVGDKDPKNIEYLKLIKKIFPDAIIIHIFRDPRSVIASRLVAQWSMDMPLWQHILAYKSQFNYVFRCQAFLEPNLIHIKYEDLLIDPERVLNLILSRYEFEFEPAMLNFFMHSGQIVKGDEVLWKKNLFTPIIKENIDTWRLSLEKRNISIIERSLFGEMEIGGYDYSCRSFVLSTLYTLLARIYCLIKCK